MIKEESLNAPRGKVIVRQLKPEDQYYGEGYIIVPRKKVYHAKEAIVVTTGDTDNSVYVDIDSNNKQRNIIVTKGDRVLLRFMPVDRFEALAPDGKTYSYATINPCNIILIAKK